mmetsp:Transcript_15396/g.48482  ORF Transcript_15396/g.48482 Transcript_15396/m.48482 type:complete len:247 (+) Transcript_15396:46-786(+)
MTTPSNTPSKIASPATSPLQHVRAHALHHAPLDQPRRHVVQGAAHRQEVHAQHRPRPGVVGAEGLKDQVLPHILGEHAELVGHPAQEPGDAEGWELPPLAEPRLQLPSPVVEAHCAVAGDEEALPRRGLHGHAEAVRGSQVADVDHAVPDGDPKEEPPVEHSLHHASGLRLRVRPETRAHDHRRVHHHQLPGGALCELPRPPLRQHLGIGVGVVVLGADIVPVALGDYVVLAALLGVPRARQDGGG